MVHAENQLDLQKLNPWLLENIPELNGLPKVTRFSGGASNWTYCLSYQNRDLVLRRAPQGTKAKGAHDMGREYRLQKALKPVYPLVPDMFAHCKDSSLIGAEFYVMERLHGIIPGRDFSPDNNLGLDETKLLCTNMVDCLVELHQVDYAGAGLQGFAKGSGYIQRQVLGWIKRYQNARTWNVPGGQRISDWLIANTPKNESICLTHNDFRLDNMVLSHDRPSEVIGVLDWELATLGDPLMDLANTLVYWIEEKDDFVARWSRKQPSQHPGMLSRRQIIDYYQQRTGLVIDDFTFYEVFASFRLSGIAQQIYYRYHHRQSRNPAFKNIWIMVNYLHYRCLKAIRQFESRRI